MDSSKSSSSLLMFDTTRQSQVPMEWCGGRDKGQDVCICLVQRSINNEGVDHNAVLALVFAHLNVLMHINNPYFKGMAERFGRANPSTARNFYELTLDVNTDDVELYIVCFNILYEYGNKPYVYNPHRIGVEGLRYTLRLLGAATHIDYHHLMSSITLYLTSIRWSCEENMLALKQTSMRKEGLRYLITRCCYSAKDTAKDLIIQLLTRAQVQGWRLFEQEVVTIVHEDLNSLLVEAHNNCDGKDSMEGMYELRDKLLNICKILMALMMAQVASQGVKCLLQYPSISKFLSSIRGRDVHTVAVVEAFKTTILLIYNKVVARDVIIGNSDRYTLLKDWTNFLEGYERHAVCLRGDQQYTRAKEAIFDSLSCKQKIELVQMTAEYGYYFNFGKPKKLLKALKNFDGING